MRKSCLAILIGLLGTNVNAFADRFRVDCSYHNQGPERPHFCYASAVYSVDTNQPSMISDIRLGIGCDYQTIYDSVGNYNSVRTIADRLSPPTAMTPAIQIPPQFALTQIGFYSDCLLDIPAIQLHGTCMVQRADSVTIPAAP